MPKAAPRKVLLTKELKKYHLRVGKEEVAKLGEEEAGMLLHQLLLLLPVVPRDATEQWQRDTRGARRVIMQYWTAKAGDVVLERERLEALYGSGGRSILSSKPCCMYHVEGGAATDCRGGRPHDVYDTISDPVSKETADREATQQLARQYCEREGITMKELLQRMQGEVE